MKTRILLPIITLLAVACLIACEDASNPVKTESASGVKKADVQLAVGADGFTTEQRNVRARLLEDNKPGAVKHLYVISPYSGQVILYSTVKGKVTSGGKRLTPTSVANAWENNYGWRGGFDVSISNHDAITSEVLQDDGTYGSSGDYLYWWDVRGAYHQHYLTGGQIVTISDQPLPVKSITINIEAASQN